MGAGALRADLGQFERPEAAREGDLNVVGDVLVAKNQDRMLFERGAHRSVCGVISRDIAQ